MEKSNIKTDATQKIGVVRIFKGDGTSKNANAYRIMRKLPNDVWAITKFFDITNDDKKSTLKYHFGPIDGDYPLEKTWNMDEINPVECQTLKDLVVMQLGSLKRHVHVSTGDRALMKPIIEEVLAMDSATFAKSTSPLYFSDKTGKFRFFLTASETCHIVVKFDEANGVKNFTIKYRTDTIDDIVKYYSGKPITGKNKSDTLGSLHSIVKQILRQLTATYDDLTNTEEVTSATNIISYKGNWSIHAKHLMTDSCIESWLKVVDKGANDLTYTKPKSFKKEASFSDNDGYDPSFDRKSSSKKGSYRDKVIDDVLASGITPTQVEAISKLIGLQITEHSSVIAAKMRERKRINSKKRGVSHAFRN